MFVIDTDASTLSRGEVTGATDKRLDMQSSSLSRSSEDLSTNETPPPLPTSPAPTEPVTSGVADLDEVQVSDLSGRWSNK